MLHWRTYFCVSMFMNLFQSWRAYCFVDVCLSVCLYIKQQFPFIFFAAVAHAERRFGIQIYIKNISAKFCFGYDRAILDRVMPIGLRKISIICIFHSFYFRSGLCMVNDRATFLEVYGKLPYPFFVDKIRCQQR
jgi:hypothetical protein